MQSELRPEVLYSFSMCCCIPFRAFSLLTTDVHSDVVLLIMAALTQEESFDCGGICNLCVYACVCACVRPHSARALSENENVRVKLTKICFLREREKKYISNKLMSIKSCHSGRGYPLTFPPQLYVVENIMEFKLYIKFEP